MEILEILKNNKDELIPEDIELFRTELIVGGYSEEYQKECFDIINQLEKWSQPEKTPESKKEIIKAARVEISQLAPNNKTAVKTSFLEQFKIDLKAMRLSDSYKSRFKAYIKNHSEFDENFVDAHFNLFESYEIDAVISEIQLSETFLEKYFTMLDKDKIARYQFFSESFYQKHFSDFNAETVLKKGKNEWRKKENRSKQFDVFLRLKGVKE